MDCGELHDVCQLMATLYVGPTRDESTPLTDVFDQGSGNYTGTRVPALAGMVAIAAPA